MWLLILLVFCHSDGYMSLTYSKDVHKILHGKVGSLHQLPKDPNNINYGKIQTNPSILLESLNELDKVVLPQIKNATTDHDAIEFKAITEELDEITKKLFILQQIRFNNVTNGRRWSFFNMTSRLFNLTLTYASWAVDVAVDWASWAGSELSRLFNSKDRERIVLAEDRYKNYLIHNFMLQFVTHARYECGKALRQREKIRMDKRYRIGYLFNRLRRLKTEMLKIITVVDKLYVTKEFRSVFTVLRAFEKIVKYDVDIKDTMDMIRRIFANKMFFDFYVKRARAPETDKTTRPY